MEEVSSGLAQAIVKSILSLGEPCACEVIYLAVNAEKVKRFV